MLGAMGVKGLIITPPSLEELFLRHYGDTSGLARGEDAHPEGAEGERARRRHLLGARSRD